MKIQPCLALKVGFCLTTKMEKKINIPEYISPKIISAVQIYISTPKNKNVKICNQIFDVVEP
jgi:hypothetical protein